MPTRIVVDSPTHPQLETVKTLFREYEAELGIDLCFQGFEEELESLPGKYAPPEGHLVLLVDENRPIGCGAFRSLGEGVCELKRIYIRPDRRSEGLGNSLTLSLLETAKSLGYGLARLDTLTRLSAANRLYRQIGFREIPAYGKVMPALEILYYELEL